jgi:cytochrome c oxidase assembly protein subunit 15
MSSDSNIWLHRFAVFLALCTIGLVFVGGLVTSTDSGLSVPDWPLSYGRVFPPMVGGILYEHGHRLYAASVGLLTIGLAVWLWKGESRRWVRVLGVLALAAVIGQGILGGLTVLYLLPTAISVSHAGTAHLFLCLLVTIAVATSRRWKEERPRIEESTGPSLKTLTLAATLFIYIQTLLGALMRHTASGLAIPDFPLSFGRLIPDHFTRQIEVNFSHRVGALVVAAFIIWIVTRVFKAHSSEKVLQRPAAFLLLALILQISLAAETVWSSRGIIPTTLHVAGGAFTLACSLYLTLMTHRTIKSREAIPVWDSATAKE